MTEKQHKASASKIRKAREKGDIPASQEVSRAAGFVAVIVTLGAVAPSLAIQIGELMKEALREPLRSDVDVYGQALTRFMDLGLWGLVMAPMLAYATVATAATLLETRGLITFAKIEPDANRVNPSEGLKRIFSARGLVNFIRLAVKAALCGGALFAVLWGLGESISKLAFSDVLLVAPVAWKAMMRLLIVAAVIYAASAIFDVWYEHFEFMRRNKMTSEEVKQENKDQFGDPHVRGERKALQREGARSAGLKETVQFSAVAITGPGPVIVLVGFGKTAAGPALMLLKKGRGDGVDSVRAELVRQGKAIAPNPALASAIFEGVAERALIPEPMSADVYSLLSQLPKN